MINPKKHTIILLSMVFFISCKVTNKIEIKTKTSKNFDVIAWYSSDKKEILAISFPNLVSIENKHLFIKEELVSHKYRYKNRRKGSFAYIYKLHDDLTLEKENNFSTRKIPAREKYNYIIYSKHLIMGENYSEQIISTYENKIFKNDSISLGSYQDFKKRLPELTKKLLKGDSLFVKFKNLNKSKNINIKRFKVPIKW